MAITLPKKGDIVRFQLVRNDLIGGERINSKVDSNTVGYSTAIRIDPELNVKHKNLFPFFQNKVNGIDDPSAYDYLILKDAVNGQLEAIGVPWIQDSTFVIIEGRRADITIETWREDWRGPTLAFFASLGASINLNVQDKPS